MPSSPSAASMIHWIINVSRKIHSGPPIHKKPPRWPRCVCMCVDVCISLSLCRTSDNKIIKNSFILQTNKTNRNNTTDDNDFGLSGIGRNIFDVNVTIVTQLEWYQIWFTFHQFVLVLFPFMGKTQKKNWKT